MKNVTQTIIINKPIEEVFTFTINPQNTPKWIDGIAIEETNEWPVKLGTIYRNQNKNGDWSEFEVTLFEPNKMFTMRKNDGGEVRYSFKALGEDKTELTYFYEWTGKYELKESLLIEILGKLKKVIEA